MKKNKKSRVFSRVLSRLAWATFYHVCEENDKAYKEVLAAKKAVEDFGGENVKVAFYDREYHLQFTLYQYRERLNRYYTVSASHGYENDYHDTNKSHVNARIGTAEFVRYCTLRRDFRDYQSFQRYAGNVLFWGLSQNEKDDYWCNGDIHDIPYDVSIKLWRDLRESVLRIANEAVTYRKVVL